MLAACTILRQKVKDQDDTGRSKFLPCLFRVPWLIDRIALYVAQTLSRKGRCFMHHFQGTIFKWTNIQEANGYSRAPNATRTISCKVWNSPGDVYSRCHIFIHWDTTNFAKINYRVYIEVRSKICLRNIMTILLFILYVSICRWDDLQNDYYPDVCH